MKADVGVVRLGRSDCHGHLSLDLPFRHRGKCVPKARQDVDRCLEGGQRQDFISRQLSHNVVGSRFLRGPSNVGYAQGSQSEVSHCSDSPQPGATSITLQGSEMTCRAGSRSLERSSTGCLSSRTVSLGTAPGSATTTKWSLTVSSVQHQPSRNSLTATAH
jgi:hypothetical protein